MPSKSANVKNEKQYEVLKDKGMSKERAADRQLAQGLVPRREGVGQRWQCPSGRDDGAAQGGGRKGGKAAAKKK